MIVVKVAVSSGIVIGFLILRMYLISTGHQKREPVLWIVLFVLLAIVAFCIRDSKDPDDDY